MRNLMLTLAGWLVAAGAVALVGLLALHLIDDHVTGPNTAVTSQDEAARQLARVPGRDGAARAPQRTPRPPSASARPSGSGSPAGSEPPGSAAPESAPGAPTGPAGAPTRPSGSAPRGAPAPQRSDQVLGSTGGTVVARCSPGDVVQLVSWTPHQGYEVEESVPGPAASGYVRFEGGDLDVGVTVSCSGGTAFPYEVAETDDVAVDDTDVAPGVDDADPDDDVDDVDDVDPDD